MAFLQRLLAPSARFITRRAAQTSGTVRYNSGITTQMACVLEDVNNVSMQEIEIHEELTDDDVRIDIKAVGVCGSDVHYLTDGRIGDYILERPMILGHEAAGVVTETGKNVTNLKVGDRVCMEPGIPDPRSSQSRRGLYNIDPKVRFWATPPKEESLKEDSQWRNGHGVCRPSCVHPADFTYKIGDNLEFQEGALVEPLAVGMHACTKAKIKPGDIAVVVGAGPIGMLAALSALASGCAKVFVADVVDHKLKVAETLVDAGKIESIKNVAGAAEKFREDTGGADVVIDCAGSIPGTHSALKYVAPGGCVVFVGCPAKPVDIDINHLVTNEIRTEAVFRYAHVFPKAVNLLNTRSIDVRPLITHHYNFDQADEAFKSMVKPADDAIKTVIHLD